MKVFNHLRLVILVVFATCGQLGIHALAQNPVPLIFDTDIGNDCDDVLALGMIHSLESRGECKLLAVTITKDHPDAAAFTDAINTFYGRGEIPIGVCRSGVTPQPGKFNGLANQIDDGDLRYPHDLISGKNAPDAVAVLRQALSRAEDGSVAICQVGFSTNLANLLRSKGDDYSELSGKELIAKKVKLLSIMAGAFKQIRNDKGELYDHKEYNVVQDLPAAKYLCQHWPTPIVWSGFEIGLSLAYPHESIEQDYGYVMHHPLADAYRLYIPPPHDRPTWDLTSVLYAVRPNRDYFQLSDVGRVTIDEEGLTSFDPFGERDRCLMLTDLQRARTLEALVQLSSQPPSNLTSNPQSEPKDPGK